MRELTCTLPSRALRAITCAGLMASCAPEGSTACFTPRPFESTTCEVIDGGTLGFRAGAQMPGLDALCATECIDFNGTIFIEGYQRLSEVPLLAKLRNVRGLRIQVDTLPDLEGIETINFEQLTLFGVERAAGRQPPVRFSSLRGLRRQSLKSLVFLDTAGVLTGSELRHVDSVGFNNVGLTELDLSLFNPYAVGVSNSHELAALRLGAGPINDLQIYGNSKLTSLEWDPELKLSGGVRVFSNEALSSCRVSDFVASTSARRDAGSDDLTGNGPCP